MQTIRLMLASLVSGLSLIFAPAVAADDVFWPEAGPGRALDTGKALTRIALGSCNRQDRDQTFWPAIAATSPDVFVEMGDNVYGDIGWEGDDTLESFKAAYATLAANREFRDFRKSVPMLVTWDDHDFGPNDGGGDFAYKLQSEKLFEHFWNSDETVRGRPGVHQSVMTGPKDRRVQLIVLDTRYFRTPLKGGKNDYQPDDDPAQQMLGAAQWHWLEGELAKPAELRVVFSSIQVLSQAHRFEKWANLPLEREHLLEALKSRAGGEVLLLSGDRHAGGIYSARPEALGREIWELTSSSFNAPSGEGNVSAREPDPLRRSILYAGANFGLVDIDWGQREVTLRLLSTEGYEVASQTVGF